MKSCAKLLAFLMGHKDAAPFLEPVNWKDWGLMDYPKVVKTPMDLGQVKVRQLARARQRLLRCSPSSLPLSPSSLSHAQPYNPRRCASTAASTRRRASSSTT